MANEGCDLIDILEDGGADFLIIREWLQSAMLGTHPVIRQVATKQLFKEYERFGLISGFFDEEENGLRIGVQSVDGDVYSFYVCKVPETYMGQPVTHISMFSK